MKNDITLIILTFLILSSCTGLKIKRADFKPIDKTFNSSFYNVPSKTKGHYPDSTMLEVFEIFQVRSDSINLSFNNSGQLQISFDKNSQTKSFDGKFKKGYFQIYFRNKKTIIPIFYSKRDIYRLRLALTKDNELIIANKWARDGNIFILAGGASGHRKYYFKQTRTK